MSEVSYEQLADAFRKAAALPEGQRQMFLGHYFGLTNNQGEEAPAPQQDLDDAVRHAFQAGREEAAREQAAQAAQREADIGGITDPAELYKKAFAQQQTPQQPATPGPDISAISDPGELMRLAWGQKANTQQPTAQPGEDLSEVKDPAELFKRAFKK